LFAVAFLSFSEPRRDDVFSIGWGVVGVTRGGRRLVEVI